MHASSREVHEQRNLFKRNPNNLEEQESPGGYARSLGTRYLLAYPRFALLDSGEDREASTRHSTPDLPNDLASYPAASA